MNILVLNCGSSSVKYKLIEIKANKVLAEGGIEKIGLPDAFIKFKFGNEKIQQDLDINDHVGAIKSILDNLTSKEYGCIKDFKEIDAVGHRVVHGGEKFNKSVLINDEVIAKIKECYGIAPLHNPVNMAGIDAINEVLPEVPQVGVFDTAFHQTMPAKSYMYALPYKYYAEDGVRRYGFHGTSHRYVSARAAEFLGKKAEDLRIITCHLGNGSSMCAVDHGKCVDTSMGITPLEGVIMGTRSGSLDPAVLQFIMNNAKDENGNPEIKNIDEMLEMLNKKSGLLGLSGISSDMRDIDAAADQGDRNASIARDMLIYGIRKYIGAYAAAMNGVDVIVFTAGIGENGIEMREKVMEGFEFLGAKIDVEKNRVKGEERDISAADSKVKVLVIPTNEEIVIARDTLHLVTGK